MNRFDEDLSAVSMLVQLCHHSVQSDRVAAANGSENLTDIWLKSTLNMKN